MRFEWIKKKIYISSEILDQEFRKPDQNHNGPDPQGWKREEKNK